MTKSLLTAFLLTFIAVNLPAQNNAAAETLSANEMAAYQTELMVQNFGLSMEQASKANAINYLSAQMLIDNLKLKKSRLSTPEQLEFLKQAMKSVSREQDAAIKTILTPAQYRQYAMWQGYQVD